MRNFFYPVFVAMLFIGCSDSTNTDADEPQTPEAAVDATTPEADETETDETSEVTEADSDETSDAGENEVDQMLTDYEEFMDEYVVFAKKAQQGDMSALAEYTSMLTKSQELGESLGAISSTMTPSQLQRYTNITLKATEAMME